MGRRSWKRWAKKRERERRATSSWERKNEVIPGKRSEIPATDGRRGFAAVKRAPFRWDEGGTGEEGERGDRREKRHRLRPCCIYHIITIIELRTTRRHLLILHLGHPRPTISLLLQPLPNSRNRKLETREYIFSSFFSAWNCLPRDVDRWQSMLTAKDHWNRGINVPGQARNFVHFTDSWQRGEIISLFRIRSIIFDSNFFSFLNFLKQLYLYLWRMTFPWIISIT